VTGAESGDSSAFAMVGSVRWLSDGRLVVADVAASRLLVFDATGRFVRPLGRRGDGPGEFRNVGGITVLPGDSLVTFDASLRRLSVWHPDAGFVRSIPLTGESAEDSWPADAWLWRDGLVVVLQLSITPKDSVAPGAGVRRWPMRARLSLRDTSGQALRTSPWFDGMYTGLYATGDGDLRWPAQRELLTGTEVDEVRSEARALAATRMKPERLRDAFAMNFAPEILPKERPAIGRVIVAPDGQLWVERFEATRLGARLQKPGDRWTILTPDGAPVARLTLPTLGRLEAVRGTRVAIVLRDSLDVQTVALYELRRQ
jgi:6-bladed beta-propeller